MRAGLVGRARARSKNTSGPARRKTISGSGRWYGQPRRLVLLRRAGEQEEFSSVNHQHDWNQLRRSAIRRRKSVYFT
jgi:hypothetical protein